jgi:hypothetical protein
MRLSAEASRELAELLRNNGGMETVRHIQIAVKVAHRNAGSRHEALLQTRRLCRDLQRLMRAMDLVVTDLDAIEDDAEIDGFALGFHSFDKAELRTRVTQLRVQVVEDLAAFRGNTPGPNPGFRRSLNFGLAKALLRAGVPPSKYRDSVAGQVFARVYADLGLSRQNEVFRQLQAGVEWMRELDRMRKGPRTQSSR